jgi:hypothetical protein
MEEKMEDATGLGAVQIVSHIQMERHSHGGK